jgi:hypothetical protein
MKPEWKELLISTDNGSEICTIHFFIIVTGMQSTPKLPLSLNPFTICIISVGTVKCNASESNVARLLSRYEVKSVVVAGMDSANLLPILIKKSLKWSTISCGFVRTDPLCMKLLSKLDCLFLFNTDPINFHVWWRFPANNLNLSL